MTSGKGAFARLARVVVTLIVGVLSPVGLLAGEAVRETLKVRVADFAPLYYRNAEGDWTGLDVELARLLVNEAGYTPVFVELPWSRALRDLQTGDLHVMMNLNLTPERDTFIRWIGPERTAAMGLVVREGNETMVIGSLDDLQRVATQAGLRWGAQRDVVYSPEFNGRLEDPAFAKAFDFVSEYGLSPKKLMAGRILGFFEDVDVMRYQIAHDPAYRGLVLHPFTLASESVYFGFSRRAVPPEAFERLQGAFSRLEASGAFDKIRQREWE